MNKKIILVISGLIIISFLAGQYTSCVNSKNFNSIQNKLNSVSEKLTNQENFNKGVLSELEKQKQSSEKYKIEQEKQTNDIIKKIDKIKFPSFEQISNNIVNEQNCLKEYDKLLNNFELCSKKSDEYDLFRISVEKEKKISNDIINTQNIQLEKLNENYNLSVNKEELCKKSLNDLDKLWKKKRTINTIKNLGIGLVIGLVSYKLIFK